jgi:hypothetical protein
MSIKCTTRVWDESTADGPHLLVMLAISDFADDNGVAWPGQALLAKKSRSSERTVRRIISELCDRGELWRSRRRAGGPNAYVILVGLSDDQIREAASLVIDLHCDKEEVEETLLARIAHKGPQVRNDLTHRSEMTSPQDIAVSSDPLLTINETTNKPASSGPPSPPAGEEKEVVEPTPLLIEEDYTLEVYYKDADRVKAKGRVKEGPWSVKCDCGNTVQIDRFNAPADCSCGMHEIVLVERKPGGAVKKKSAAVDLYYRIAAAQVRYGSMEEWEADISATVSDLDRWRAVVKTAVSSRSINPRNIANLLNCYRDDRLPGQKKGGAVDSRPSKVKRIIKQKDGTEREVEFVRMPQNGGNTR